MPDERDKRAPEGSSEEVAAAIETLADEAEAAEQRLLELLNRNAKTSDAPPKDDTDEKM